MARRGVFELRHVLLRYELAGGSSAGVRSFVETDLVDWARAHPFVRVETQIHRGHPNVIGQYSTYPFVCSACNELHTNVCALSLGCSDMKCIVLRRRGTELPYLLSLRSFLLFCAAR